MILGVFGGIGSGKSEVLRIMKEGFQACVLQADQIAKSLYEEECGYEAVVRICGREILDDQEKIDRHKMADLLFHDEAVRRNVNAAIHPMVYFRFSELTETCLKDHPETIVIYEAAILPENREKLRLDYAVYVYSEKTVRIRRLTETRGMTESRIESVMQRQPSEEEYRAFCDFEIENNGDIEELKEKTYEIIKYCQRKQR